MLAVVCWVLGIVCWLFSSLCVVVELLGGCHGFWAAGVVCGGGVV